MKGSIEFEGETQIRVRYHECDPMGVAHHSVYATWLELGRTDLLRCRGTSYAELEKRGVLLVVAEMSIRFRRPARYDDDLRVLVRVSRCTRARLEHAYEVRRGQELLATAETTLACVDRDGRVQPMPSVVCSVDQATPAVAPTRQLEG